MSMSMCKECLSNKLKTVETNDKYGFTVLLICEKGLEDVPHCEGFKQK